MWASAEVPHKDRGSPVLISIHPNAFFSGVPVHPDGRPRVADVSRERWRVISERLARVVRDYADRECAGSLDKAASRLELPRSTVYNLAGAAPSGGRKSRAVAPPSLAVLLAVLEKTGTRPGWLLGLAPTELTLAEALARWIQHGSPDPALPLASPARGRPLLVLQQVFHGLELPDHMAWKYLDRAFDDRAFQRLIPSAYRALESADRAFPVGEVMDLQGQVWATVFRWMLDGLGKEETRSRVEGFEGDNLARSTQLVAALESQAGMQAELERELEQLDADERESGVAGFKRSVTESTAIAASRTADGVGTVVLKREDALALLAQLRRLEKEKRGRIAGLQQAESIVRAEVEQRLDVTRTRRVGTVKLPRIVDSAAATPDRPAPPRRRSSAGPTAKRARGDSRRRGR